MQSLNAKLALVVFALLGVVAAVVSLHTIRVSREIIRSEADTLGRSLTHAVALFSVEPLLAHDYPVLETYVESLTRDEEVVVFVRVEHESGALAAEFPRNWQRPANSYREYRFDVVARAASEPRAIGRVLLGVSTQRADRMAATRTMHLLVYFAVAFAIAGVVVWFALRRLVGAPLATLVAHARALGEGNLTTAVKLESTDELGQLAATLDQMRMKLRVLHTGLEGLVTERTRALDDAMQQLWGELALAKKIQTALIPHKPTLRGCDVAATMRVTEQVGGDYYDVATFAGKEWILIGDVSGHGVPAGLVMMMAQTAVHTALGREPNIHPDELLAIVNRTLSENIRRLGENKYMTLCAICRDERGVFHVASGHQDIFVHRAATKTIETLPAAGPWLGLAHDVRGRFARQSFALASGDAVLLYTDGVTEARCGDEMLDGNGLARVFAEAASRSAEEVVDAIVHELETCQVDDDVSLVVIRAR